MVTGISAYTDGTAATQVATSVVLSTASPELERVMRKARRAERALRAFLDTAVLVIEG